MSPTRLPDTPAADNTRVRASLHPISRDSSRWARERLGSTHSEEIVIAPGGPSHPTQLRVTGRLRVGEPGSLVGVPDKESEMTPSQLTKPHRSARQLHGALGHGKG
jgi:hypothetical protein